MNEIDAKVHTGTIGELLVQLRLLQYGVQAAAPIKDSGNDLIAVKGNTFRGVSIRTTRTNSVKKPPLARIYNVLAIVKLAGSLDNSQIFLIPHAKVVEASGSSMNIKNFKEYAISQQLVRQLFG